MNSLFWLMVSEAVYKYIKQSDIMTLQNHFIVLVLFLNISWLWYYYLTELLNFSY